MNEICCDLVSVLPELWHIDMSRVGVCYVQARKAVAHGMQATLTPMRCEGGELYEYRHGTRYTTQRLFLNDLEMLYILSFYLPRFMEETAEEKVSTIVHELWHIGDSFDGDLRRHEGRCYMHSSSQKEYDEHALALARRWWRSPSASRFHEILHLQFDGLKRRFGRVHGRQIAHPKLLPVNQEHSNDSTISN